MTDTTDGDRIAKVIARAGVCSRREAERMIEAGRVTIGGKRITSPARNVGPDEAVTVDGVALPAAEPARLWRLHKPAGVLTSTRDPDGRPTIYDLLPEGLPRIMPVGRLDMNSEGLLLLTNDGGLKRRLELPATGWRRRYRVRLHGRPDDKMLAALAAGVTVEGIAYGPIEARVESQLGANAWLAMTLSEGKNREIRRVCEHLGLQVNRLIRVAYGPFQLGQLAKRHVEEVRGKVLRDQVGLVGSDAPARARDGKKSGGDKTGTARAKPRPVKPGYRKLAKRRQEAADASAEKKGAAAPNAGKKASGSRAGSGQAGQRQNKPPQSKPPQSKRGQGKQQQDKQGKDAHRRRPT